MTRIKFIYSDGTSNNMSKDDFDGVQDIHLLKTFKININHYHFNTLFLKFPVSECSSFDLILFLPNEY